ncbi:MAG: PilZ domain-containing protein [Rhodospirillales bacterium]|nr:PilZ domain-containing protein [Rhodospirillales bacterium]
MFQSLFSNLQRQASNDPVLTQRHYPRRANDRCVIDICGQTFPVENWSYGGILLWGDERMFGMDQEIDFTLKFKLRNNVISINHRGHVVRKQNGMVALKFEPLNHTIRRAFHKIVDDAAAREFANSQAV